MLLTSRLASRLKAIRTKCHKVVYAFKSISNRIQSTCIAVTNGWLLNRTQLTWTVSCTPFKRKRSLTKHLTVPIFIIIVQYILCTTENMIPWAFLSNSKQEALFWGKKKSSKNMSHLCKTQWNRFWNTGYPRIT